MNELVNQEKTQLQALFDPFNQRGSWMTLAEGREQPMRLGIMEGYTVTRVAPQFDTRGNVTHVEFWLFHKALGYHEGFQHAHTIKVVRWSQEDTYLLDLVDDRDRRFHIELIFPGTGAGSGGRLEPMASLQDGEPRDVRTDRRPAAGRAHRDRG